MSDEERNKELMARNLKAYATETAEERSIRQKTVCKKCIYRTRETTLDNACNYITDTGRMRPCAPNECVEKGVFKAGRRISQKPTMPM